MRAIPIRGVIRPLNLTERQQQNRSLASACIESCIECGRKAPQGDEQGRGKTGAKCKQERVRGGIPAPAHWH
jgi:hypothetical protein